MYVVFVRKYTTGYGKVCIRKKLLLEQFFNYHPLYGIGINRISTLLHCNYPILINSVNISIFLKFYYIHNSRERLFERVKIFSSVDILMHG